MRVNPQRFGINYSWRRLSRETAQSITLILPSHPSRSSRWEGVNYMSKIFDMTSKIVKCFILQKCQLCSHCLSKTQRDMLKAVVWEHLQRGETRLVYPFITSSVSCELSKEVVILFVFLLLFSSFSFLAF